MTVWETVIIGGGMAGVWAALAARAEAVASVCIVERAGAMMEWMGRPLPGDMALTGPLGGQPDWACGDGMGARLVEAVDGQRIAERYAGVGITLQTLATGAYGWEGGRLPALRAALLAALEQAQVAVRTGAAVEGMKRGDDGIVRVWFREGDPLNCRRVILAPGGARGHMLKWLEENAIGHIAEPRLGYVRFKAPQLAREIGVHHGPVTVRWPQGAERATGALTLSGRGLEGPVIAALAARLGALWHSMAWRIELEIDWLPQLSGAEMRRNLLARRARGGRATTASEPQFGMSPRLWGACLRRARIDGQARWQQVKERSINRLIDACKAYKLKTEGAGMPSVERAWAGGVATQAVDWESGRCHKAPWLALAGEVLDTLPMPEGWQLHWIQASACLAGQSVKNFA